MVSLVGFRGEFLRSFGDTLREIGTLQLQAAMVRGSPLNHSRSWTAASESDQGGRSLGFSSIRAQAREEMRNPIHGLAAANRIALLRTGRG